MINQSIGFKIANTSRLIVNRLNAVLEEKKLNITMEQFTLLHVLATKEVFTQKELSDFMNKDKSGILRTITLLEKKGMVEKSIDENNKDKRKKNLRVTSFGKKMIEKVITIESSFIEKLQSGISKEQLNTFNNIIDIMCIQAIK
jgi:DNA-binding MarR family transcriptional regulator